MDKLLGIDRVESFHFNGQVFASRQEAEQARKEHFVDESLDGKWSFYSITQQHSANNIVRIVALKKDVPFKEKFNILNHYFSMASFNETYQGKRFYVLGEYFGEDLSNIHSGLRLTNGKEVDSISYLVSENESYIIECDFLEEEEEIKEEKPAKELEKEKTEKTMKEIRQQPPFQVTIENMNTMNTMNAKNALPTLIHVSKQEMGELKDSDQFFSNGFKPCGLWLSHEDGFNWKQWCEQEQFPYGDHEYAVTIDSTANIASLDSLSHVEEFFREFSLGEFSINWEEVAKNYDGIYVSEEALRYAFMNNQMTFLYGWDLTSACIWNADIVKTFEKI